MLQYFAVSSFVLVSIRCPLSMVLVRLLQSNYFLSPPPPLNLILDGMQAVRELGLVHLAIVHATVVLEALGADVLEDVALLHAGHDAGLHLSKADACVLVRVEDKHVGVGLPLDQLAVGVEVVIKLLLVEAPVAVLVAGGKEFLSIHLSGELALGVEDLVGGVKFG